MGLPRESLCRRARRRPRARRRLARFPAPRGARRLADQTQRPALRRRRWPHLPLDRLDQGAARRRERERPSIRDAPGGAGDIELATPQVAAPALVPDQRCSTTSIRTAACLHPLTLTSPEPRSRARASNRGRSDTVSRAPGPTTTYVMASRSAATTPTGSSPAHGTSATRSSATPASASASTPRPDVPTTANQSDKPRDVATSASRAHSRPGKWESSGRLRPDAGRVDHRARALIALARCARPPREPAARRYARRAG
jgi:hypothetical protein